MIDLASAIQLVVSSPGDRLDYFESLYRYASMLQKPCQIVEIGSGKSTIVMACAIHGTESQIVTIDPIFKTGSYLTPDAHRPGGSYHTMESSHLVGFHEAIRRGGLESAIRIVPRTSREARTQWDGSLIDLLFVDGEHTEQVVDDCEWMQYVRPGGYAAFDDWFDVIELSVSRYMLDHPGWALLHRSTNPPKDGMVVTLFQKTGDVV